jgi:amino acid transporter
MPTLVRSWFALSAVLAPALALAQQADPAASTGPGFGWLWILAGVVIVAALFWIVFGGRRGPGRPMPPTQRP